MLRPQGRKTAERALLSGLGVRGGDLVTTIAVSTNEPMPQKWSGRLDAEKSTSIERFSRQLTTTGQSTPRVSREMPRS
jgi:hypothetical protein